MYTSVVSILMGKTEKKNKIRTTSGRYFCNYLEQLDFLIILKQISARKNIACGNFNKINKFLIALRPNDLIESPCWFYVLVRPISLLGVFSLTQMKWNCLCTFSGLQNALASKYIGNEDTLLVKVGYLYILSFLYCCVF